MFFSHLCLAPQLTPVDDNSNSYSEINSENVPPLQTQQSIPSRPNNKLTFVERSTLQQDITRGQIIPSTFKPVTIIWNRRLDVKERNLIINNYTSGTAVHESLLLDNSALPNLNGSVSISMSTPKRAPASPMNATNPSPANSSYRNVPRSSIRQNLEEGSNL